MMNKAEDKKTADDGGDGRGGEGKGGKGGGEEFHVNSPFSPPPEQKEESSKEEDAFKTPSPTSNRFVGTENTAATTTTNSNSNSKKKFRPNINNNNTHHVTWFNPEAKTAEKRSWLQSNRKLKNKKNANANIEKVSEEGDHDVDDDDDDENIYSSTDKGKRKTKFTFEKFLVVGLHPDRSDFTAVADSPREFREASHQQQLQQQQQQQQNPNNNNNNSHNNSNSNSRRRSSKDVRVSHPKHTPPHRGTVGETYSADVLFSYPPSPKARIEGDDEDSNTEDGTAQQSFDVESIAHFCFPSGVEPKLVEKTASMSKILEVAYGNAQKTHDTSSFVFRLTGGESGEEPLYGVCLYANEFVSQMPVIASSSLSSALSPNSSFSEETIPSGGDGEGGGEEANLRKYLVAAPRCYCFITKTPFFKTTFEVLRAVVTSEKLERLRRDERRLMKDLEMAFSRSGITPTKPPPPPLPKTSGEDEESKNIARDLNFSEEAPRTLKSKTDSDVKATSSHGLNMSVEEQTRKNDDSLRILESFHAESIPKLGDATRVFNGPLIKDEAGKALNSEKKKSILDAPIPFYRPVSTTDDPCFERKCIRDSVGKITYTYDEEAAHIEPWAIAALCRSLSIENIMAFMACALLEKQVVVFSPNLGQLSGVILSLLAMLRPLRPRGLFLPILPNSMTDFLEAPVPFIVGIQHKTNDIRQRTQHITRLNAYKDEIKIMGGIVATAPNWHELREKLRPIHASIRLAAETQVFSSVLEPSEKSSKLCGEFGECFRNHMRDAILGRIRSYSIAEVGKDGQKVAVLLKDELVDSYVGRDRSFMKNFCETQLFTAFTDELLDN
ncbi:unnamed protein product [Bathycoccus prasinos]